jgi:hypothetical protein
MYIPKESGTPGEVVRSFMLCMFVFFALFFSRAKLVF